MEYDSDEVLQARVDELEALLLQATATPVELDLDGGISIMDGQASPFLLNLPLEATIDGHDNGMLPFELLEHLLDTFFEFMYQFNFFMSAKDFRRRLVLPASHPNSPHPALMTSIFLVASHFSARELSDWQPVLIRRTHQLICQSAALGDRPMDLCMAAVMFARFCFHTTRFDLGLCYASSAVSFAVGCGFHRITAGPTVPFGSDERLSVIPPPRDEAEVIQRIRMWHSIFMLDRGSSWTSGIPPYLAEEEIVTPWPVSSSQELHVLLDRSTPILQNLYGPVGMSAATVRPGDNSFSIRARSIAFYDKATFLDRAFSSKTDQRFWDTFSGLTAALGRFRDSLPPLFSDPSEFPIDVTADENQRDTGSWCRTYTLLMAQTCVLGSLAIVHGILDNDEKHARLSLEASMQLARIVRELKDFNPRKMPILVISGWVSAATRLLTQIKTSSSSALPMPSPREVRADFDSVYKALLQIKNFYPIAGVYTDALRERLNAV